MSTLTQLQEAALYAPTPELQQRFQSVHDDVVELAKVQRDCRHALIEAADQARRRGDLGQARRLTLHVALAEGALARIGAPK